MSSILQQYAILNKYLRIIKTFYEDYTAKTEHDANSETWKTDKMQIKKIQVFINIFSGLYKNRVHIY